MNKEKNSFPNNTRKTRSYLHYSQNIKPTQCKSIFCFHTENSLSLVLASKLVGKVQLKSAYKEPYRIITMTNMKLVMEHLGLKRGLLITAQMRGNEPMMPAINSYLFSKTRKL
jgi:hypothetical protein